MKHDPVPADRELLHASGGALPILHHRFGPREGTPRLALVGGFEANAFNAVAVLSRLASFLRRVDEQGAAGGWSLSAPVMVVPAVRELRRSAPRRSDATRIAVGVQHLTKGALRRIAILSSYEDMEHTPQVRLEAPYEDEREAACLFGLPVVEETRESGAQRSPNSAWRSCVGESLDIEVGRAGQLEPKLCESVFRALLAFMDRIGLLQGVDLLDDESDLHYFEANHRFDLRCGARGLFVPLRKAGDWLQAGDTVGRVYDAFDGDPRHEVRTPVAGLLGAIRRQPLVEEGARVAQVLSPHASRNSSSAF